MKSSQTASVARSPKTARQGSPGMIRASAKVMKMIPNRTGIVTSSRRRMNWITSVGHRFRIVKSGKDGRTGRPADAPFVWLLVREASACWRIEEATPQARPVVEGTGPADVERMLGVPHGGVAGHDVIGVESGPVAELDA